MIVLEKALRPCFAERKVYGMLQLFGAGIALKM